MIDWQISVTVFKPSGKWHAGGRTKSHTGTKPVLLSEKHRSLPGWELLDLMEVNDPSVRQYSPLPGGFESSMYFEIEVEYPSEVNNFCHFLVTLKG